MLGEPVRGFAPGPSTALEAATRSARRLTLPGRLPAAAWLLALGLAGCAGGPALTLPPPAAKPIVLLGEVHDNATQHRLRLQAFRQLLAGGARPALLMEQFDRERQPDIDRARSGPGPVDAQRLIDVAGAPGWDWTFYRPFLDEALRHGLPIVAANVSRSDARRVMSAGLAASGFDAVVPEAITAAQAQAIVQSHCGMIDAATARRMSQAQVARDQFMARLVEQHADRGVLMLAGNGHVRTDIGVPHWLSPATRARTQAVGVVEQGDGEPPAYDQVVVTPRQPREDPCKGMAAPAAAPASAARR